MASRKLPFIVQPRSTAVKVEIGTEATGIIEVERRGYTTVGEKTLVQQGMRGDRAIPELMALVGSIAETNDKDPQQVLQDLTVTPLPEYLKVYEDAAADAMEAVGLENMKRDLCRATAILISRVDPEWTVDDTMGLDEELVKALAEFYVKEEAGAIEVATEEAEESGAEGKE